MPASSEQDTVTFIWTPCSSFVVKDYKGEKIPKLGRLVSNQFHVFVL